jgi:opacity protein-like surface antigen
MTKRALGLLSHSTGYLICIVLTQSALAQGLDTPLTMQGLDHLTPSSAASRSVGGLLFGLPGDPALMFSNPASLRDLKGLQFSVGGLQQHVSTQQTQQWIPEKYFAGFSLLMEGLTGGISDPDPTKPGTRFINAEDTVQRPFDTIGPNWSRSANRSLPIQLFAAMPFFIGEYRFSAGIGVEEYANLDHYYQNNNVLAPSIGSQRPVPILLPLTGDTVDANWYQYSQSRDGSIYGYGAAVAVTLSDDLSLGVSGLLLKGTTDDSEMKRGRGLLHFVYIPQSYFFVDSVYSHVSKTGTSDFSGLEFTVSAVYRGRNITLGASVKPPARITRKYQTLVQMDTTGLHSDQTINGQDEITLPWRGALGLALALRQNLTLGFEYEFRPYASAVYKNDAGRQSNPWLSASLLHLGVEYVPLEWLALRGGVRQAAEVFQEEGAPIVGEPVGYSIYSAGAGITFGKIHLDITYEYSKMKYQDLWESNVNLYNQTSHTVVAGVSYEFQ